MEDFALTIEGVKGEHRPTLDRLCEWAALLGRERLATFGTYHGTSGRLSLLPRLPADGVGLVTVFYDNSGAYLSLWRSVFERRAPKSLERLEKLIAPTPVGKGNSVRSISDDVLDELTSSYREAAAGGVTGWVADTAGEPFRLDTSKLA
jgi:hypothetical protein